MLLTAVPAARPVVDRAGGDQRTMSAMHLTATHRQPRGERGIQLGQGRECPPGQDVLAHDLHLPFHPTRRARPIRSQHIDTEAVLAGERGRVGVQRHPHPRPHVPLDGRLGPS